MGAPTTEPKIVSLVKRRRTAAGLSQLALAERVGVSRQALIAIEAGRQVPSTGLALQLARALGCGVGALFELVPEAGMEVSVAPDVCGQNAPRPAQGTRVAIGRIEGRWVAHRVADAAPAAADGVLEGAPQSGQGIVEPWVEAAQLEHNVLVAGCAPLLGVLAQRLGARHCDARMTWLPANSAQALDLLDAGLVHVAGLHLSDARTGRDNLAVVRKRFPGRRMLIVNLTRWRQGLVVAPANPLAVRDAGDLLRPDVRCVRREAGAGASKLLQRLLTGSEREGALRGPLVTGHAEVAQLVRCGAADAGVAIEAVALALGLGFVALAEERFDLIMPLERARLEPVARLIDAICDASFRREAAHIPGYDTAISGEAVTLDAA